MICLFLLLSGLGYGWHAAVIESQEELDYIYTQQQKFEDDHSYWVGGSVLSDGSEVFTFNFSDYRQSQEYECCEYQCQGCTQGRMQRPQLCYLFLAIRTPVFIGVDLSCVLNIQVWIDHWGYRNKFSRAFWKKFVIGWYPLWGCYSQSNLQALVSQTKVLPLNHPLHFTIN